MISKGRSGFSSAIFPILAQCSICLGTERKFTGAYAPAVHTISSENLTAVLPLVYLFVAYSCIMQHFSTVINDKDAIALPLTS